MRMSGRWRAVVAALAVVGLGTAILAPASPATAAELVLDGSTSSRAAASCWTIKQSLPSSGDGLYWLQTPQLVAPKQFYCDMTTDGGGWILVGGEGWSWSPNGQGSQAALRATPTGPQAFARHVSQLYRYRLARRRAPRRLAGRDPSSALDERCQERLARDAPEAFPIASNGHGRSAVASGCQVSWSTVARTAGDTASPGQRQAIRASCA